MLDVTSSSVVDTLDCSCICFVPMMIYHEPQSCITDVDVRQPTEVEHGQDRAVLSWHEILPVFLQ